MKRYQQKLNKLVKGILNGPGQANSQLRNAVAAKAAEHSGKSGMTDIPEDLAIWVEKVAKHAYKTTPEEIDALKAAGYSEDQIFELTVSAATGAARYRMESALRAVHETEEVPHEARGLK